MRKKLELLEHALEEETRDEKEVRRVLMDLLDSDKRWQKAFRVPETSR